MAWETIIGLEVHVQLKTHSKLFSGSATSYPAMPNEQANIIDLGMPGVLPVLNERAVEMAVRFGLAINAAIAPESVFARKNYFYPDLPKGYQISQFDLPIVGKGQLDITLENGKTRSIGITRAHLEEDAGKSLHEEFECYSGIDLNRAGIPLLEIVSEPDLRTATEAVVYLKTLHTLVKYLDICDGNLQEGSFRMDVNVSVRPDTQKSELGTRCEIKNINSFRFVEKAIHYEVNRQIECIETGQGIRQETRLYDPQKNETRSMRSKEAAEDYRYFPDPDLLPLRLAPETIDTITRAMPELPQAKKKRFIQDYQLNAYDASLLVSEKEIADFFENCLSVHNAEPSFAKLTANWIIGELSAYLNKHLCDITSIPISAQTFSKLIQRIQDKTISGKIAKSIFEILWENPEQSIDDLIEKKGLQQITNEDELRKIIQNITEKNPAQVAAYRAGKDKLFGYFIGQIMKATQGKANPQQVNALLKATLNDIN